MDFVCCVSVPDDEFAVLGSGYEVPTVISPMHGVDFGQMTPECPSRAHHNPWKWVDLSGHGADYQNDKSQGSGGTELRNGTNDWYLRKTPVWHGFSP